jgi:hypothetical protein
MTADPLPSVARVRKARRSSRVSCGHHVLVGQVIVRRGQRWVCLQCALADIETSAAPAAAAPPKETPE